MGGDINKLNRRPSGKIYIDLSSNRNGRNKSKKQNNNIANFKVGLSTKQRAKSKLQNSDAKKKKDKIIIEALNKEPEPTTAEEKALKLIQKNNKNNEDYEMMYSIISNHFLMNSLSEQAKKEIISKMSLYTAKAGTTVFKQGEIGVFWYIVHKGELKCYMFDEYKKTYKDGDSFGVSSLMNNMPRTSTVKAETDCELWTLRKEVFRQILDYLSQMNYEENMQILDNINLPLELSMKQLMANNLIQQFYKSGTVVCKEGEQGDCMFIIKEGEVNCVKDGKIIRTLKKGDNFGQKAILEGHKRTLDCITKTDCTLCSISVEFFQNQFGDNYKELLYFSFINIAFQKSKYFKTIIPKMLEKSFNLFTTKNFKKDEVIYEKDQNVLEKLCIVLEGNIKDKGTGRIEAKRYEILFEDELMNNNNNQNKKILNNDLYADPDCVIAEANYAEFQNCLGGKDINSMQLKSHQLDSLDHIELFKLLSDEKKEIMQSKLKTETYQNGKKIMIQGTLGDKVYIIKKGRVDFYINSKYSKSSTDGEEFGAKSLILNTQKRSCSAIANGVVVCYTLSGDVFRSILEPNLIEYFQKKFCLEDTTMELKDLDNIKTLGKGSYGFVNLVRYKRNKQLYAIKALNLMQIKKEKLEESVELEKSVLLKVDHPFIMKMVKYLKNESYIFFITEYIRGKELFEVIREIGFLSKEQTQFYGASMLLAIDYLHKNKIVYRDCKPENVMVNEKSYIKIIDFGTVKEIKERTSTIVGTAHYMAPEVIKGMGYSFQVDIWSIAVCMYEFFCGELPFGNDLEDPLDIYSAVTKDDLKFPTFITDIDFMSLIRKMLTKSPTSRLWKLEKIKEEAFFKGFLWNDLLALSMTPPYILELQKENYGDKTLPYLTILANKGGRLDPKRRVSIRQMEFDKWLKNF